MTTVSLQRLLKKTGVAAALGHLSDVFETPFGVYDEHGRLLFGAGRTDGTARFPLMCDSRAIGWVTGTESVSAVAAVVNQFIGFEGEKKALGRETLAKYAEINMLYDAAEKISACLTAREVGRLIVNETAGLDHFDQAAVTLFEEDDGRLRMVASTGREQAVSRSIQPGDGIFGDIFSSGQAEIVNDAPSDPRYRWDLDRAQSLIATPLKAKNRPFGLICLTSQTPCFYTSEDLKILQTLSFQAAVALENARLYNDLRDTFLATVNTLAETIEVRDNYTGSHTRRVRTYSLAIARELNLSETETEMLELAAVLHDVGKIGVPDVILLKSGELSLDEFNTIKKHTLIGEEILGGIKQLKLVVPGVKHHHERYDGRGYPDGKEGEEIELSARIIAVADSFDAMRTNRPYRGALSVEDALSELSTHAGTQFDPKIVDIFIRVYRSELR
jgi:putative nucleotidyltransferase with HDIG domain